MDHRPKCKTLEEKIGENLGIGGNLDLGKDFFDTTQQIQSFLFKLVSWTSSKLKISTLQKTQLK